ncbi:interleukin-31 receptor subunit alpha [Myotis myotis]|uniref:Interleukin 31 receptor A n=1 Tax=Myotis myotis TaxID=51298 RepID=A0A7J7XZE0_MYOMY|nr:interleukin-31 receptor subunit alpha [Myotis myotis]KAF6355009.1 interleukin 31 receptor A [Myotis myotis]
MWAWVLWALPLLCPGGLAALPAKPENISCIYYYGKNFTCTWSPEKEASHTWYRVRRTHSYGRKSDTCDSTSETPTSCSFFPPITIPDNYTIQVEAQNADGTVESAVTHWRLDTIVKMDPPVISSVKPVLGFKRMLQIQWAKPELAPASSALQCRLRFRTANSTHWMEVSFWVEETEGNQTYNLTGLRAFTEYKVALRCVAQESAFWSGWSPVHSGTTEEEAPLGLDLWRVLGPTREDGSRPVRLLWKKARGAPALERVLGYHVWYFPENTTNLTETMNTTRQPLELTLGAEAYRVSVVAYNSLGQGPAAALRIPAATEEAFPGVKAVQAHLSQDQLVVAWQNSTPHVDSWRVEWSPDLDSEPPTVRWEAVTGARNWTIRRDELDPLQCYNISVYPMWQDRVGKPCSVQAYAKEGAPSVGPVTKVEGIGVNTVTIRWEEIPKHLRNGFIRNYTIFYQPSSGEEFAKTVGASTLQCGLESLTRRTSYYVWVMASTSAGGFNGTTINFKTLSISVLETCLAAALGGGGLLILSVLAAACGLRKPKFKRLCWPDVPNPAESSLAAWRGGDLKDKLHLREVDDAVSTEDRILKPGAAPSDLIDKLAVNFENFLEEVSAEEAEKGQENILGGDKNEYVISPFRPYCLLEPLTAAEAPPTAAEAPPTAAGGPPMAAEVPPTVAEVLPMAAKAPPTSSKAPPTAAEALPTAAEAPPTAAEAPPAAAGGPPTSAEVPPTVAEAPPTASKASPTAAKAPPTSSKAPPTVAEVPPREPQCLCSGSWEGTCPEAEERLLPSAQGPGPACACEEGALNPYLKNSVTTREFLVSEELPDQTKTAI